MKFLLGHRLRKQSYSYNEMKLWYEYYKPKQKSKSTTVITKAVDLLDK